MLFFLRVRLFTIFTKCDALYICNIHPCKIDLKTKRYSYSHAFTDTIYFSTYDFTNHLFVTINFISTLV